MSRGLSSFDSDRDRTSLVALNRAECRSITDARISHGVCALTRDGSKIERRSRIDEETRAPRTSERYFRHCFARQEIHSGRASAIIAFRSAAPSWLFYEYQRGDKCIGTFVARRGEGKREEEERERERKNRYWLSTSGYLIIVTRPSDVNCRLPRVRPRLAKSGTRLLSPALQASDVYPPRRIYHPTWLNCWSFFSALLRPSRERLRARGGNDRPSDVISRLIIDRRNWLARELFERVERKTVESTPASKRVNNRDKRRLDPPPRVPINRGRKSEMRAARANPVYPGINQRYEIIRFEINIGHSRRYIRHGRVLASTGIEYCLSLYRPRRRAGLRAVTYF